MEDVEPGLDGDHLQLDDPPMKYGMDGEQRKNDTWDKIVRAEQKLQQARTNTSADKNVLIEIAQKDLEWTQEFSSLQYGLRNARKLFSWKQKHLKKWEIFVKWIDDQYPAIASECRYTIDDSTDRNALTSRSRSKRAHPSQSKEPPSKRRCRRTPSTMISDPPSRILRRSERIKARRRTESSQGNR